jgi:hypothetical protein
LGCDIGTANRDSAGARWALAAHATRVIEHVARIRVQLPRVVRRAALFRAVAIGLLPSGP